MNRVTVVAVAIAGACFSVGCAKGPEGQTSAPPGSSARTQAAAPSSTGPSSQPAAQPARDVCALLSAAEATAITGIPIERVAKTSDGCEWYATAAVQREKGEASARGTFEKMSKQEPASFDEHLRNMESLLKGLGGAVAPGGPLFAVSVQSENADQAEAVLKGTINVVGAGLPGGRLEPIDGLGDRAYLGPVGSFLYVRKGPVLLNLGLASFPGTREQAIALARQMVSRL